MDNVVWCFVYQKHLKHWQKDGEKSFWCGRVHISILFAYYNGCVNVISTPNCIQLILHASRLITHELFRRNSIARSVFVCFNNVVDFFSSLLFFCSLSRQFSQTCLQFLFISTRLFFHRFLVLSICLRKFNVRIRKNHINSH